MLYSNAVPTDIANHISEKYGVHVELIGSDQEYFSDATIQKNIDDHIYFVSQESPEPTGRITEYLIKHQQLQHERRFGPVRERRMQKADERSAELIDTIKEIQQTYRDMHEGKEPSLNQLAYLLNTRGIDTPGGHTKWYAVTVKRVISRTEINR